MRFSDSFLIQHALYIHSFSLLWEDKDARRSLSDKDYNLKVLVLSHTNCLAFVVPFRPALQKPIYRSMLHRVFMLPALEWMQPSCALQPRNLKCAPGLEILQTPLCFSAALRQAQLTQKKQDISVRLHHNLQWSSPRVNTGITSSHPQQQQKKPFHQSSDISRCTSNHQTFKTF